MPELNPALRASEEALSKIKNCIDENICFRLEAGAGAGKTYSLIESLKYIIKSRGKELLKSNQKVACITYTNIAKDEILERTDAHPVIFSDTIHAFCWSVIKNYPQKLKELIPSIGKWQERIESSDFELELQSVKYELGYPKLSEDEISISHNDVVALMALMLENPKFQKNLKSRFPVIFIDEYQDTDKELASAILINLIENDSGTLVGFFGDHWQKIYGKSSCGLISSEQNKIYEIGKEANFRADKNLVHSLNRLRPELPQAEHNPGSQGNIKIFHTNSWMGERLNGGHWKGDLPAESVKQYLEITQELISQDGWDLSPSKTKILFLTNNLIANEQSFSSLAACFKRNEDYLKKENKYIKYLLEILLPSIVAFEKKDYGELFEIISRKRPSLTCQNDKRKWVASYNQLLHSSEEGSIGDILDILLETQIPVLPQAIHRDEKRYADLNALESGDLTDEDKSFIDKLDKLRAVSFREVINLSEYVNLKTPFATKHGVKGAEFDNVLVLFGRGWNQYNWNQMLEWFADGIPSDKQDSYERNRNLFYVSCSRAKHNLTLLFTQELSGSALNALEQIFGSENIFDIAAQ